MIPLRKGFTLIELLVVVAIVGFLATAALALISPPEQLKKTRDLQRKDNLNQTKKALELYYSDNNKYPPAVGGKIDGINWGDPWQSYMAKLPKDPLGPPKGKEYYYLVAPDQSWYTLCAKLERSSDPQTIIIPGENCTDYNYAVTSSNIGVALLPTSTPTPTPRPFKYVFVTSGTYKGDLKTAGAGTDGLDGGNKICKSLADNSTIPSVRGLTWNAWLSTSTVNAVGRVLDKEYKRLDGAVVTDTKEHLIDGGIDNPINRDENNENVDSNSVWTGTKGDGTSSGNDCASWANDKVGGANIGDASSQSSGQWTLSSFSSCSNSFRLYCFEQ